MYSMHLTDYLFSCLDFSFPIIIFLTHLSSVWKFTFLLPLYDIHIDVFIIVFHVSAGVPLYKLWMCYLYVLGE